MRHLFLALVLVFSLGNASEQIEALVDKSQFGEAVRIAEAEAERGDPVAHAWLGRFYEAGEGVTADARVAAYHYRVAAKEGNNYARWRIGVMIDTGTAEGSLEEAVAMFRAAAAEDYTDAIVSLAVMQATGRGTAQDDVAALASYMRAARMKDSGGVRGVGVMFHLGQTVKQDSQEALAWFLVAAAMGEQSFYYVAESMPDSDFDAIEARAIEIAEELGLET